MSVLFAYGEVFFLNRPEPLPHLGLSPQFAHTFLVRPYHSRHEFLPFALFAPLLLDISVSVFRQKKRQTLLVWNNFRFSSSRYKSCHFKLHYVKSKISCQNLMLERAPFWMEVFFLFGTLVTRCFNSPSKKLTVYCGDNAIQHYGLKSWYQCGRLPYNRFPLYSSMCSSIVIAALRPLFHSSLPE